MIGGEGLIERLPAVRGRLTAKRSMADLTWLRVGGPAEVLFQPADSADLAAFLAARPQEVPLNIVGVGSNLIVRDGGLPGVTIRLGRGFGAIEPLPGARLRVGAAVLDAQAAKAAAQAGIAGLEFLRTIPGAIGGALRMNAGCYGAYMADVVESVIALDGAGREVLLGVEDMAFAYRASHAPADLIFTEAVLRGAPGETGAIEARMAELVAKREASQPTKDRTAGSTFRNPAGFSSTGRGDHGQERMAWRLIDEAGCRGLRLGGAQISEKHSNFLTNAGGATAADLEALGEEVRRRVKAHSGVELHWEIQRIGVRLGESEGDAEVA